MQKSTLSYWLGALAMPGLMFFFATALVLQFVRLDLDWVTTPISFYLLGPGCVWLIAAYFVLGASILCIALAFHLSFETPAQSPLALALFAIGAVSVCVVAVSHTDTHAAPGPTLHGIVHNLAALIAFLTVTLGMLLRSWTFSLDARWRRHFPKAFGLASLTFVALLLYGLWSALPRGAAQKFVILLIVLWLMLASRWLTRQAPQP
ncbi:MAG TPA: DUF998 domain-containing protein [Gammaproteobacteria bacterium]|nr:DUF998 domain-containing protein [Gammaproteobacteria bacterium]